MASTLPMLTQSREHGTRRSYTVWETTMAKITGIGGVFFKSRGEPKVLAEWYQKHLGLPLEPWGGAILRWPEDKAEDKGLTVWTVAKPDTKWFAPSDAAFMINYRVDDMDGL